MHPRQSKCKTEVYLKMTLANSQMIMTLGTKCSHTLNNDMTVTCFWRQFNDQSHVFTPRCVSDAFRLNSFTPRCVANAFRLNSFLNLMLIKYCLPLRVIDGVVIGNLICR